MFSYFFLRGVMFLTLHNAFGWACGMVVGLF